ncbi:hypothetical protein BBX50_09580 [Ensifer sp. LC11]|nr:hypothetical protein BBX50_09580 [Ensifer sp. LC11]
MAEAFGKKAGLRERKLIRFVQRCEVLRLSDLYCVTVRIIEAEHALSPRLALDGVYQFHMRRDAFKGRVDIVMLEVKEQISSSIAFRRNGFASPDGLFQRSPFMDRKTTCEEDEGPEVLQHRKAKSLLVELLGSIDVADERDWIDKPHGGPFVMPCH